MNDFIPPIYWRVKNSEQVRDAIETALQESDAMYFEARNNPDLVLVPFNGKVSPMMTQLWNRKQLEITAKYQN